MIEALRASLGDAKHILLRRCLQTLGLIAISVSVTLYLTSLGLNDALVAVVRWIAGWILGVLIFSDAMRILAPGYRLTLPRVLQLVALTAISLAFVEIAATALSIPTLVIPSSSWSLWTREAIVYAAIVFAGSRLALAPFALARDGVFGAISSSWRLTAPPTFVPTTLVVAVYDAIFLFASGSSYWLRTFMSPFPLAALNVAISLAVVLCAGAIFYPAMARWMIRCRNVHAARLAIR